jgi:hypothetical protein
VAALAQAIDDGLVGRVGHRRRPAQDPEILAPGVADDGPRVARVEVDDPVIAPERAEEADLELRVRRRVDHARAAEAGRQPRGDPAG